MLQSYSDALSISKQSYFETLIPQSSNPSDFSPLSTPPLSSPPAQLPSSPSALDFATYVTSKIDSIHQDIPFQQTLNTPPRPFPDHLTHLTNLDFFFPLYLEMKSWP